MDSIADQLRIHPGAVRCGPHQSGIPVVEPPHRIIEMYDMGCSGQKGPPRLLIARIGVSEREDELSAVLADEALKIRILIRSESDDPEEAFGGAEKAVYRLAAAGNDVFLVLRPLPRMADKGSLHIEADEIRPPLPAFREFRPELKHILKLRNRESHGRRTDCRDPVCSLIFRNALIGLPARITDIIAHCPVKMNVEEARDRKAALCVQNLLSLFSLRPLCEFSPPDIDLPLLKDLIRCIDESISDDHCPPPLTAQK